MKLYCEKCKRIYDSSKKCGDGEDTCPKCGDKVAVPESVTANGAVIGDFRIIRPISSGGMGEVFLAHQVSLDRPAALKVLQQKFVDDREYVESLFREARLAAKLNHPNIVQAYAVGEEDGVYYFAMEYVEGETFKQILKKNKVLDFNQAAKVICEIAGAINAAWTEQKLVHQDIKPDNIMLAANGSSKLADLGLCQIATGNSGELIDDEEDEVLGTPQYISPEQLTGVATDVRSDIYSLGATFFQFVTGRFPYVAENADDIARMHVAGNLEPPKKFNPEVPDELNNIIVKMMARDIEKRYQSAADLVKDLNAFLNRKKSAAVPPKAVPALSLKKPAAAPKAMPSLKVPSKPAVPPAPVPAAVPAPAPAAVPVPAATENTRKEVEVAAAEPESPAVDESENIETPRRKFSIPPISKPLVISVASVAGVLILLGVALYLCHANIIPDPVGTFGRKMLAAVGIGNAPEAKEAVSKAPAKVQKKKELPPKPVAPPKPKTRPQYIAEIKKIIDMPRNNHLQRRAFHREAEKFLFAVWNGSKVPVTLEESQMVSRLASLFAPIDEKLLFADGREKEAARRESVVREYQEKLAEARQAEEERREAETRRVEEERRRREAERRQAEEEQRRFEAQRRLEQQRRFRELQKRVADVNHKLCIGFYAAALKGDFDALSSAVRDAGEIDDIEIGDSADEKKAVAEFRAFRDQLSAEAKKLRAFVECVEKLNEDAGLVISFGKEFVTITGIKAGEGINGKVSGGKIIQVKLDTAKQRSAFFRGLGRYAQQDKKVRAFLCTRGKNSDRVRDNNTEFYYSLMNGEFSPAVRRKAPNGFWKRFINMFSKSVSKEMIKR